MNRPLIALGLAVAAAGLCASTAHAGDAADDHLRAGLEHFEAKDYELAIDEFRAGYALDPRPELLFALGQAERLSGDCKSAIVYYREFLELDPPEGQARAARSQLARCHDALASAPTAAEQLVRRPSRAPGPPPAPAKREPASRRWYSDRTGVVLLGSGAGALLLGGALLTASSAARGDAAQAETYQQFDSEIGRASTLRALGVATTLAGTALIGAAVYRFVWKKPAADRRPVVSVGSTARGGLGVAVAGRF